MAMKYVAPHLGSFELAWQQWVRSTMAIVLEGAWESGFGWAGALKRYRFDNINSAFISRGEKRSCVSPPLLALFDCLLWVIFMPPVAGPR